MRFLRVFLIVPFLLLGVAFGAVVGGAMFFYLMAGCAATFGTFPGVEDGGLLTICWALTALGAVLGGSGVTWLLWRAFAPQPRNYRKRPLPADGPPVSTAIKPGRPPADGIRPGPPPQEREPPSTEITREEP